MGLLELSRSTQTTRGPPPGPHVCFDGAVYWDRLIQETVAGRNDTVRDLETGVGVLRACAFPTNMYEVLIHIGVIQRIRPATVTEVALFRIEEHI